jgi:hypothetical protein
MSGKVLWGQATAANRTREIRPSGMRGGLTETWAMVEAKRARTAETSKPPSFDLRLRALYFYPTASSMLGRQQEDMPGSEPHSGNPTVWDRRGACGNVN